MSMECKTPVLTKRTAETLAVKVLGTARGLKKDEVYSYQRHNVFEMQMGEMFVRIRTSGGRISLTLDNHFGTSMELLFDPATLEEDFTAEDKLRSIRRREDFADIAERFIRELGLEGCRRMIERGP